MGGLAYTARLSWAHPANATPQPTIAHTVKRFTFIKAPFW